MLDEGVVASAGEIDACLILGAGFPFFRGGLTPYLDAEGVSTRVSGRPARSSRLKASAVRPIPVQLCPQHRSAPETRKCADPQGKQHQSRVLRICTRPTSTRHFRRRSLQRAWKPPRSALMPGTASRSSTPVRTPLPRSRPAPPVAPHSTTRSPRWMRAGKTPSNRWRVRYGLMLGLERVLASPNPATASGTDLRRHQIDALAGHAHGADRLEPARRRTRTATATATATDDAGEPDAAELDEEDDDFDAGVIDDELADETPAFKGEDPGASRRYRFRHPTASGKTIAAAGFVESARHLGVLILTHRRLLVSQFTRDLTTEGYAERFTDAIDTGMEPLRDNPITIQTYAWFARHATEISRSAYQLVICDEAHTALGEKTSAAIRSFSEPIYIGMTATEQLIAKQVSDVFPASVDDLPLADAARRGPDRAAAVPAGAARCRDQLGADRRRRLRGARPRGSARPLRPQPGGREPLPRALRHDARHRLRGRRRARLQPRAGVPRRRASRPRPSRARRRP